MEKSWEDLLREDIENEKDTPKTDFEEVFEEEEEEEWEEDNDLDALPYGVRPTEHDTTFERDLDREW